MGEKKKKCPMCSRKLVDRNGIPTCPDCGYRDPQYNSVSSSNVPGGTPKTPKSILIPKRSILATVVAFLVAGVIGLVATFAQKELWDAANNFVDEITAGKEEEPSRAEKVHSSGGSKKQEEETVSSEEEEKQPSYRRPESDFLISLLERVFDKPIDEVSYEEICSIVCLDFYYLDGTSQSVQALDVWLSDGNWKSYLLDEPKIDAGDFACLENLEELYLPQGYGHTNIRTDWHNLKRLQFLSCDATLEELTKYMDVSQLVYLEIKGAVSMRDLAAASAYTNLDCLILDTQTLTDLKGISEAPKLKALYIQSGDRISDFSELYNMPQLEQLSIHSSGLQDIGFVSGMDHLQYLELKDTGIKDISALADCADTLTQLYLIYDYEIEDISPVLACSSLETLQLWVNYSLGELPDFSAMKNLQSLSITGYEYFDNLSSLTGLTELTLNGVYSRENGLSHIKLPNLKKLNLINTSLYYSTVEELVSGLEQLEVLNLKDSFLWSDISPVFELPNLVELNLEGVQCGLMPERLTVCENLTTLNMTRTVFRPMTEEGEWYYNYGFDDVKLSTQEVLNAMAPCMPMLDTLYAPRQELDDLSFTANLPQLWMLDVTGNKISDLSPLLELEWLRILRCGNNPVQSQDGLENVLMR